MLFKLLLQKIYLGSCSLFPSSTSTLTTSRSSSSSPSPEDGGFDEEEEDEAAVVEAGVRSGEASEEDGVVWDAGVKRSSGSEVVVVAAWGDEDDDEGRAKSWVDWSRSGMSGGKREKHLLYWVVENNSEQLCVLRMTRTKLSIGRISKKSMDSVPRVPLPYSYGPGGTH